MARTRQALEQADGYRAGLQADRQAAMGLLADAWQPSEANVPVWVRYAAQVLEHYQQRGVRRSATYVAAVLTTELDRLIPPEPVDVTRYAGTTRGGVPLVQALGETVDRVRRQARAAGAQEADASRSALLAAQRTASYEVLAAPDRSLTDLIAADPRVRGWRRIARPGACGACLAAADGRIRPADEEIERHPHCQCVQEIVVRGVPDHYQPPTGRQIFNGLTKAEQDALFHGRGGAEKAELIRSGQVPLSALITRAPRGPDRPDVISETPLAALSQR